MYNALHISITSACNMECPDCVYGMRFRKAKHADVDVIVQDCQWFGGIKDICITGGEPTTHPQFLRIVTDVRKALPEACLAVETNGRSPGKIGQVAGIIDALNVTLYGEKAWDGCPDNSENVKLIRQIFPKVRVMEAKHLDMSSNKGCGMCGRENRAHYADGIVYGCCVGPGVKGAVGIKPGPGWHETLKLIQLPCCNCVFGMA